MKLPKKRETVERSDILNEKKTTVTKARHQIIQWKWSKKEDGS